MFVMCGCSASRATACISTASRKVGPRRAAPLRYIGASMCTKGNGTNSVKPPVSACKSRTTRRCRAQDRGCSTCPYMIVDVVRRPRPCAVLDDIEPLRRVHLVRADDGAHLVVQDLGGGARQGAQAGGLELRQKRPDRQSKRRRALRDLQRREGVNVHLRDRRLDGAADARDRSRRCSRDGCRPAGRPRWRRAPTPRSRGARFPRARGHTARRAAPHASCPWRRRRTGSGSSRCWCS